MALSIRVSPGDWGGALPEDINAVARSAAESLDVLSDDEDLSILIEPTASEDDSPIALMEPGPAGEFVVRLPVRGNLWARFAYQSSHEICHVLADTKTIAWDRFTWIEEVICETASLFALRKMATTWREDPPYPNWTDYATNLADYASERIVDPRHCVPPGESFMTWFARTVPSLEADSGRRDDNTVIAKELLPVFETIPGSWRAVRSLHDAPRGVQSRAEYLSGWGEVAPGDHLEIINEIRKRLA